MNSDFRDSLGKLLLRVSIACLLIFHGYSKLLYGTGFIEEILLKNDMPSFLAYGIYLGEILAPILLIIGYKTRFAAFLIIVTMISAIYLVFPNSLIELNNKGALILELQYLYLLSSSAILIFGPGRYSIDKY